MLTRDAIIDVYEAALRQISRSAREESCTHEDCESYQMRRQSRALQDIARNALAKTGKA